MNKGKPHSNGGGFIGFLRLLFPQFSGDDGVNSHADADGKRQDNILERVYERDRGQGLRSQPGHENTVYNVVK